MKFECEFNIHDNEFNQLDKLLKNLEDLSYDIEDDAKAMAATDAKYLAQSLAEKYEEYMATFGYGGNKADKKEVTSTANVNRAGEWTGAPSITIDETKTGFTVKMSGKDILFQEFGTGLIGEGTYEGNLPGYWHYASGDKILQGGKYKNGSSNNEDIPSWYLDGLKDGWIPKNAAVWYSPMGVTEGNIAGQFMYDAYTEYLDNFETKSNLQLGRKNLQVYIKNKLLDDLK